MAAVSNQRSLRIKVRIAFPPSTLPRYIASEPAAPARPRSKISLTSPVVLLRRSSFEVCGSYAGKERPIPPPSPYWAEMTSPQRDCSIHLDGIARSDPSGNHPVVSVQALPLPGRDRSVVCPLILQRSRRQSLRSSRQKHRLDKVRSDALTRLRRTCRRSDYAGVPSSRASELPA